VGAPLPTRGTELGTVPLAASGAPSVSVLKEKPRSVAQSQVFTMLVVFHILHLTLISK